LNFSAIGEFGFINRIKDKVPGNPGVILGIGDDAAVTVMNPGMMLLTTTDMLAQGVHFDLVWHEPVSLGRKSLAVNLSDIAAMGGIPRFTLLSLAIPAELNLEFIESFMSGFLEMADRFGVTLIGGDTSSSKTGFVISVTLIGEQYPDRIAKRSGACHGDLICVSGTLGDSALGLDLLKAGDCSGNAVKRHLDPVPQVELSRILSEKRIPSAMIDISDGLYADLGHILESSSVGARICIDEIPLSDDFRKCVASNSPNYYKFPLAGGEDYELLFTLHPAKIEDAEEAAATAGTSVAVIGKITAEKGLLLALADGSSYDTEFHGYDHFACNR